VLKEIFRPKREKLEEKRIHNGELRHLQVTSSPNIKLGLKTEWASDLPCIGKRLINQSINQSITHTHTHTHTTSVGNSKKKKSTGRQNYAQISGEIQTYIKVGVRM